MCFNPTFPIVTVLDVQAFERLLGPCMDIMKRNINEYEEQLVTVFGSKAAISDLRWTFGSLSWHCHGYTTCFSLLHFKQYCQKTCPIVRFVFIATFSPVLEQCLRKFMFYYRTVGLEKKMKVWKNVMDMAPVCFRFQIVFW